LLILSYTCSVVLPHLKPHTIILRYFMKKQIYVIALLLGPIFSGVVVAAENAITNNNATLLPANNKPDLPTQQRFSSANTDLVRDICPLVGRLVTNSQTHQWGAPGGWKTTSPSFLHSVDAFLGAQWVGVGIGEVICIYGKIGRSDFPITLQRKQLVPAPAGEGMWSTDKGGYMECKSNNIEECPFFVQVPKKGASVYDQLDFHKGKPVEDNN
jgi:hypothetical protein